MTVTRQIVLDTETTGLEPEKGHRIIEIGCIELQHRQISGRSFHVYINPQRPIESEAVNIHGLTDEFLADKPPFELICTDFLAFIKGAELIIHNAPFDVGFLDHELARLSPTPQRIADYCTITDTLALARQLHPGQRNNLDALCKRYGISTLHRKFHGGLLDAELLALAYLAMTAGQNSLFEEEKEENPTVFVETSSHEKRDIGSPLILEANPEELLAHQQFLEKIRPGKADW